MLWEDYADAMTGLWQCYTKQHEWQSLNWNNRINVLTIVVALAYQLKQKKTGTVRQIDDVVNIMYIDG